MSLFTFEGRTFYDYFDWKQREAMGEDNRGDGTSRGE